MKMQRELTGCDPFGKNVYNHHYQRVLIEKHKRESSIRFMVKSMLAKILFDENTSFVTEWQYMISNKVIDSLPLVDVDNNVIYRFNDPKVAVNIKNFRTNLINIDSLKINVDPLKELENELRARIGYEKRV